MSWKKRTRPWSGICACICSPPAPSQVHLRPSSEPKPDRFKRKHRHDTNASTRHEEEWGMAIASHSKKTKKTPTTTTKKSPLKDNFLLVLWSTKKCYAVIKMVLFLIRSWWLLCTSLLCPCKPSRDGWYFPGTIPQAPLACPSGGARRSPQAFLRPPGPSCLTASVHPKLKAWHMDWRAANSANLGSLSVCVGVNSVGKGVPLWCLMDRLWLSLFF